MPKSVRGFDSLVGVLPIDTSRVTRIARTGPWIFEDIMMFLLINYQKPLASSNEKYISSSLFGVVAQLASASPCHGEGCGIVLRLPRH